MLAALLARDPRAVAWLQPDGGDALAPSADWVARFLARAPAGGWDRTTLTALFPQAGDAARAALASGALVVTGQQPALGGGPLYSLVKTAHAIALAGALTTRERAVAPLFWCASEDHDLGEAGHADLLARDGTRRRVRDDFGGGRASLRFRSARAGWDALVAACRDQLGPGPGAEWLAAHAPERDEGLGAWLCRLMTALFARHGLLAIEAHRLRPLFRPALARALDAWPATALASRRGEVLAAGHADAFGALDAPPLFADRADGRVALDPAAARALLATDPDALSPGAALRPVLQQAALPAALYVAGPGELAYHAFLGPAYDALAAPRPLLVPRASLALAPGWFRRACAGWGVAPDALAADSPAPARPATLAREIDALGAALEVVAAPPLPSDMARRRDAGTTRLRRELDRLRASLARGDRRAAGLPPFTALTAWLFPGGGPQERVMSLVQAVWEHGPGVADLLVAAARALPPGGRALVEA